MLGKNMFPQGLGSALVALLLATGIQTASHARDLTDLDLEELSQVNVFAASVLNAHIHNKGEWMFSVDVRSTEMDGNRDGTSNVSDAEVLQSFAVTPTKMDMDVYIFHAMYGLTTDLTLIARVPYLDNTMDHLRKVDGARFTTNSKGMGDIKLFGNYIFHRTATETTEREYFATLGLSLPTGSINKKDNQPAPPGAGVTTVRQRLPYPMQLGSGTYDLLTGLGMQYITDDWYWGVQGIGTIRLQDENGNDYRLGNRLDTEAWVTKAWTNAFSTTARLEGTWLGDVNGADPALEPIIVPTADPNLRAKKIVNLLFAAEYAITEGMLAGHQFHVEFGKPVYQDLDGPQLKTDWVYGIGWLVVF